MLRSLKELMSYSIKASDGEVGSVKDFYFSPDADWAVRYIVADTGGWLSGRLVLLAPDALKNPDWRMRMLEFSVSKREIEQSPPISADMPVSRKKEMELAKHYDWTIRWAPLPGPLGPMGPPAAPPMHVTEEESPPVEETTDLRSVDEVTGYKLHAEDGEVGTVSDVIVDDESWKVRYLVVELGTWFPGRKVLISKDWVKGISWRGKQFSVDLTKNRIEKSPEYDPTMPVNVEYEKVLYDYYGRPHFRG